MPVPRKTPADAIQFLAQCISECEADGYQQHEDNTGEVPDGYAPDDWTHDSDTATILLRFGECVFRVKVTRSRDTRLRF